MGHLQCLRSEAAPLLHYQLHSYLLRTPPATIADISLTEELLAKAALGEGIARRLFGDLAHCSEALEDALAETGILMIEGSYQHGKSELDLLAQFFLAFDEDTRQAD